MGRQQAEQSHAPSYNEHHHKQSITNSSTTSPIPLQSSIGHSISAPDTISQRPASPAPNTSAPPTSQTNLNGHSTQFTRSNATLKSCRDGNPKPNPKPPLLQAPTQSAVRPQPLRDLRHKHGQRACRWCWRWWSPHFKRQNVAGTPCGTSIRHA